MNRGTEFTLQNATWFKAFMLCTRISTKRIKARSGYLSAACLICTLYNVHTYISYLNRAGNKKRRRAPHVYVYACAHKERMACNMSMLKGKPDRINNIQKLKYSENKIFSTIFPEHAARTTNLDEHVQHVRLLLSLHPRIACTTGAQIHRHHEWLIKFVNQINGSTLFIFVQYVVPGT